MCYADVLNAVFWLALAPLLGGVLVGIDRKLTARMQGRVGPPVVQPFYDVLKLMQKENLVVRRSQNFYVCFFLISIIFTATLFFYGGNILLVIFSLTLAEIFLVLGAYKASSPYSFLGAERELIQMVAYEPALIISGIGMYMVTKSFYVRDIAAFDKPLASYLPGVLFAFVFVMAMKFRKSPFDLSASAHAHQELVKGLTTEFTARTLGLIEIAHWYENIITLGFVYLFFANDFRVAIAAAAAVYLLVILIDNTFARLRWQLAFKSSWITALIFGAANLIVLFYILG